MRIVLTAVMLTSGRGDLPSCAPSLRVLPITIYNRSRMREAELDVIVDMADRLWRPYGVTIASGAPHGVAVIVDAGTPRRDQFGLPPTVLGTTLFSDGHAKPYIHLWVAAAEAVATADSDGRRFSAMPPLQRDAVLLPMLGVALAHELGHYLLDTARHSRDGLLQTALSLRELRDPSPQRLALTGQQQRALCARDFGDVGQRH